MKKYYLILSLFSLSACAQAPYVPNDDVEAPPCEYVECLPPNRYFTDGAEFSPQTLFETLQARRIAYPEVFTQIAIKESGWELKPNFKNNFFGFACNPKSPFVCGCKGEFSEFATPEHTFAFLRQWIAYAPPNGETDAYSWLKLRGYNPDPVYYEQVKSLDFWNKID